MIDHAPDEGSGDASTRLDRNADDEKIRAQVPSPLNDARPRVARLEEVHLRFLTMLLGDGA
jgi:hypothetical protein